MMKLEELLVSMNQPPTETVQRDNFLMVFCALLLVRGAKATIEQSLQVVPLLGKARYLAASLYQ